MVGLASNPHAGVAITCKYRCKILSNDFFRDVREDIQEITSKIRNHNSSEFHENGVFVMRPTF